MINILNEARDYPLYHATDTESALAIIQSNKLIGSSYRKDGHTGEDADSDGKVICFTRNNSFLLWYSEVRFKLDANKLSHNYKIENYFGTESPDWTNWKNAFNEFEERIYVEEITNLDKYIIEVQLVQDAVEAFQKRFKRLDLDSIDELEYNKRRPDILNVVALANQKGWISEHHKKELSGEIEAKPVRSAFDNGGVKSHNGQYDKQDILNNIQKSKDARDASNYKQFATKINTPPVEDVPDKEVKSVNKKMYSDLVNWVEQSVVGSEVYIDYAEDDINGEYVTINDGEDWVTIYMHEAGVEIVHEILEEDEWGDENYNAVSTKVYKRLANAKTFISKIMNPATVAKSSSGKVAPAEYPESPVPKSSMDALANDLKGLGFSVHDMEDVMWDMTTKRGHDFIRVATMGDLEVAYVADERQFVIRTTTSSVIVTRELLDKIKSARDAISKVGNVF